MPYFYPNRPDVVERCRRLARSWGAELQMPRLSWKYDWIRRALGWTAAKHVQRRHNELKTQALRAWDRTLARAQGAPPGDAADWPDVMVSSRSAPSKGPARLS
jgi:hypothetical protein